MAPKRTELHEVGDHREDAKADVVFVHGLGGNARTTWMADKADPRTFWPCWLAEMRPDFNVWSLDYPSSMTAWRGGHGMTIRDAAQNLLDRLQQYGVGARPVLFVVHSLGGLVVKQMLKTAWESRNKNWRAVLAHTRGIAFLATPHTGATLASFLVALSNATGLIGLGILRRQGSLRDLAAHDVHLGALNDWYRERSPELQIASLVYREDVPYKGGLMVVDPSSANPGLVDVPAIPIARDHLDICKPADRNDQVYVGVWQFIEKCLADGTRPPAVTTFLFSDIEGSTRLWEQEPQRMGPALARHDALVRTAVETHSGTVVKMTGDGVYAVFGNPADALNAAVTMQRALADLAATNGIALRARCGLHVGVVERRENDFFGSAVNRAARLMGLAHGGQVLLSQTIVSLVGDNLPNGVGLRDLGSVRLRDLATQEHVYQLTHPHLRRDFPALRSLEATPNNLPRQIASFVGRDREMAEVKQMLSETRLLTMIGAGGLGKTRLSLQVAADVLDDYADGAWFVDLSAIRASELVPKEVAQTLGIKEEGDATVTETLCAALKSRRLLLILDNCEHLVLACATLVEALVQAGPDIRVIATSREPLQIGGEQHYLLQPLSLPDPNAPIEDQACAEAVQLFVERARLQQATFALTDRNRMGVATICLRLDGIPLAVELAAARVGTMPVAEIADRLANRLGLLTGGSRTALPKQQTLRAMLDWSYDLLSGSEKAVFARAAVFAGGWSLDAAVEVVAGGCIAQSEVLDQLTALARKSLIVLDESAERYRMLETIREYAAERLANDDEDAVFRERSRDYFLSLAERGSVVHVQGGKLDQWMERLRLESDNLRAALKWSLDESKGAEAAMRFCAALYAFWWRWGRALEGRDWCDRALVRESDTEAPHARLGALLAAGIMHYTVGDLAAAQSLYGRALTLSNELGDLAYQGRVLISLANVELSLGNTSVAKTLYERAIDIERQQGNLNREVTGLNCLASLFINDGNLAAAETPLERAVAVSKRLENREQEAYSVSRLGSVAQYQGNHELAQARHREALAIARELGLRELESEQKRHLAEVAVAREEFDDALALLREALALSREQGSWFAIRECLDTIVVLATAKGEYAAATKFFGAVEKMRETMCAPRFPIDQERSQASLARCRALMGEAAYIEGIADGASLQPDEAVEAAFAWTNQC